MEGAEGRRPARRWLLLPVLLIAALIAAPATLAAGGGGPERISEAEAIAAADRDPKVLAQEREHGELGPSARRDDDGRWEVVYFAGGEELALAIVDPASGEVLESWTGHQVAWKMARGYEGAFGHALNAPYVFLPLCALFLLGLVDWRRPWRLANLDLAVLLGFGLSHFFFNRGEIGVSVPLQYPVLLYLLGRCLWIGLRGRGEGLAPVWPAAWLLIASLFLMGFRVGLNIVDSGVIDVGYAGVVGADLTSHGEPVYDNFPDDFTNGDTYGPVNYFAYVPFELLLPWSGSWDNLPAAHAAAIAFDVLAFVLLALLGQRLRPGAAGRRLGATLAFGWAAYPYTAYVLESNANDTLVAALLVAVLLLLGRPLARGATLALASFAKFAPVVLAPMLLTYRPMDEVSPAASLARGAEGGGSRPPECGREPPPSDRTRAPLAFALSFVLVTALAMLWPAVDPGLATFYDRTVGTQAARDSPFSIWGQVEWLEPLRIVLLVATAALSIALAFRPRRKSPLQVAALGAALLIATQLTLQHWFYLYVVWFYPLLLVALAALPQRPGLTHTHIGIYWRGGTSSDDDGPVQRGSRAPAA